MVLFWFYQSSLSPIEVPALLVLLMARLPPPPPATAPPPVEPILDPDLINIYSSKNLSPKQQLSTHPFLAIHSNNCTLFTPPNEFEPLYLNTRSKPALNKYWTFKKQEIKSKSTLASLKRLSEFEITKKLKR